MISMNGYMKASPSCTLAFALVQLRDRRNHDSSSIGIIKWVDNLSSAAYITPSQLILTWFNTFSHFFRYSPFSKKYNKEVHWSFVHRKTDVLMMVLSWPWPLEWKNWDVTKWNENAKDRTTHMRELSERRHCIMRRGEQIERMEHHMTHGCDLSQCRYRSHRDKNISMNTFVEKCIYFHKPSTASYTFFDFLI